MGKYWLKIGLSAALIFAVGFALISAGRRVKNSIVSGKDITIPLGPFVDFKVDGTKFGTVSQISIQRNSPRGISGFELRTRISDSAALERLRECHLAVTGDPTNIDERTAFTCLKSDSSYEEFGSVRLSYRQPHGMYTLVQPLYLPASAIREFRHEMADSVTTPLADSLAAELKARVRPQARAYRDSIRADALEKEAKGMQRRADSIRGKLPVAPAPLVRKP